jgi:DNA-binding HxlR family transcriptional regulator
MLEGAGIITRKLYACAPPKTTYSLALLGHESEHVIRVMADFDL